MGFLISSHHADQSFTEVWNLWQVS